MNVLNILKYGMMPFYQRIPQDKVYVVIVEREVHEYMCDVFKGAMALEEVHGSDLRYNENSFVAFRSFWLYAFENNIKYDPITLLRYLNEGYHAQA